ncbi:ABC transporter ATP-binding protein [Oerskovia sp. M15]
MTSQHATVFPGGHPASAPPVPTAHTASLVSAQHVTRRFGDVVALDDVTLEVGAASSSGSSGPTVPEVDAALARQRAAQARLGRGPALRRRPARRLVPPGAGADPQETGLPATLKVREVVDFVGKHFANPIPTAVLLEQFGLAELAGRQTGAMSGGQKRRLAVALSLVGRPRVVLLDEPTTGLDVGARQALWAAIREYHAGGGTVLLTSHYLEEVQALAERVVVIDQGVVKADDTLDAILRRVGLRRVVVRSTADLGSTCPVWCARSARPTARPETPAPGATSSTRRTPTSWSAPS